MIVAVQFAEGSLDPIALIPGLLRPQRGHRHRFEVGEALIVVAPEDLLGASWVEGLGEEPALRIDLPHVQVTVSPGSQEMADPLEG